MEKREEAVLEGHTDEIYTLVISSDDKYIISGSKDKTIRIWNLLEKSQEFFLEGQHSDVLSLAITSDNKYIISGFRDGSI